MRRYETRCAGCFGYWPCEACTRRTKPFWQATGTPYLPPALPSLTRRCDGYVYVIDRPGSGEVKIGFSRDPYNRLYTLQTHHGAWLRLVAVLPGNLQIERRLHQRFAADRMYGEWFRESDAIANWIKEVQSLHGMSKAA